jgi:hypothetical protein
MLALISCADEPILKEYSESEYIGFKAALTAQSRSSVATQGSVPYMSIEEEEWAVIESQSEAVSRASVRNQLNGLEVGVYGSVYSGETKQSDIMTNNQFKFINNEEMRSVGDAVLWKNVGTTNKLKVYSYAPYNSVNISIENNIPKLTYTPDTDISKQIDIISSDEKEVSGDYKQKIPLAYHHITTGIKFKVGFACTVESVTIENVYSTGTYAMNGIWSIPADATKTSYILPISDGGKDCAAGAMISGDDQIMMMVPQRLPDDAKVKLQYSANGTEGEIVASLKGLKWEKGKLITYTIYNTQDATDYIYFDLNAGNITIEATTYTGYVFETTGTSEPIKRAVTGNHSSANK